ncbi:hypothetical protein AB0F20_10310 [Streptomyces goshikiensis]|uniref:hypothetical protein n=1 Tax=Streptomyces goshikiensis TaxID=1942 RepID=UPI0033C91E92
MSTASAATLRAAIQSAQAAATATAHTAGLILIEANGGRGEVTKPWAGEQPPAWCHINTPFFSAYVLAESIGDRVHITLPFLTPAGYERMRTWAQDQNECHHDHDCGCLADPWPKLSTLREREGDHEISFRDGEYVRGTARMEFNQVKVTLDDEPVMTADSLIRHGRESG